MTKLSSNRRYLIDRLESQRLIKSSNFNDLLIEYNLLKLYFQNAKSASEAEMNYYNYKFDESGCELESRFSLYYHGSLKKDMEDNKNERKKITEEITILKKEIKEKRINHSLVFKRKKKIERIKNGF